MNLTYWKNHQNVVMIEETGPEGTHWQEEMHWSLTSETNLESTNLVVEQNSREH